MLVQQCEPRNTKAAVLEQRPRGARDDQLVIRISFCKSAYRKGQTQTRITQHVVKIYDKHSICCLSWRQKRLASNLTDPKSVQFSS
jgi:hypothetical protein